MSHLEERLQNDLTTIRNCIAGQTGKVEVALDDALQALQSGHKKLAYATILNDYPINRTMREIDRLCHRFIAVHLPSGAHLRFLSAAIRVNIELERMGDYAVTIAREAVQLSSPPANTLGRELDRIATETMLMFRQSTNAFNQLNAELAHSTKLLSGAMEYNLSAVYQEIANVSQVKDVKDTLALFVVFNQLKRVADQAKNLCEDAIFAATGAQKDPKVFNVLFVDEDNSFLSQLAEAVARKNYPDAGHYRSAGRVPAQSLNAALIAFMADRGISMESVRPAALTELTPHEIADQEVIVSLQGDVESYFPEIPFHTSALQWDIEVESVQVESLYRTLALQVKDLMVLLRGEEG